MATAAEFLARRLDFLELGAEDAMLDAALLPRVKMRKSRRLQQRLSPSGGREKDERRTGAEGGTMIVDLRTYTMVPGRLAAYLKLCEAEGLPNHIRHLGNPIGIFTTNVGELNQVVFFWGFESQADREKRRAALEADPDWVSYRKKSAETGNVQHQENKVIVSTKFSPL
jgi:hypothetical protein